MNIIPSLDPDNVVAGMMTSTMTRDGGSDETIERDWLADVRAKIPNIPTKFTSERINSKMEEIREMIEHYNDHEGNGLDISTLDENKKNIRDRLYSAVAQVNAPYFHRRFHTTSGKHFGSAFEEAKYYRAGTGAFNNYPRPETIYTRTGEPLKKLPTEAEKKAEYGIDD